MKPFHFLVLALAVLTAAGCAKKADPNKPIDQVRAEAEKMTVADLEANAKAYADAIASKKGEITKIQDQLKTLSPTEMFGDKAKGIKDQISQVSGDLSALTERYNVYAQKFQSAGGDVSKIQLK